MEIRDCGPLNRGELCSLYESVGWTNYTVRPDMLEAAFRGSLCAIGAYDVKGRLIGVVRAVGDGASVLFVQDLLVRPEWQGRGVGTALLRALLDRYPDVYQTQLLTDRTEKTCAFYRRMGFAPAGEMGCEAFVRMQPAKR